ncbi:hypothetical protein [Streptomyces sp. NPDC058595]|uniref:hypothetical protein n=1 Tax=Streptomyces sp. NPDC058595 TaxID=3346550 RepID=UPI00364E7ADA
MTRPERTRADDCPDAVLVEGTVTVFHDVAPTARSGAASRRPGTAAVEEAPTALGRPVERIRKPGTPDGGDVRKAGDTAGGRTKEVGVRQVRRVRTAGLFPPFRPCPRRRDRTAAGSRCAPRGAEPLADLGSAPVPVDIRGFESLEGHVTCLSVRPRDLRA